MLYPDFVQEQYGGPTWTHVHTYVRTDGRTYTITIDINNVVILQLVIIIIISEMLGIACGASVSEVADTTATS